ncbi:cholinesterase 2-like [Toxorhynchites rutilus septentrionalis]|uniref:cholinesterase 2-like n=1 Tax=Toxorhynchites rutilus septentrionalis TaxID=329112 RepID=UPI002479DC2F|nr:cholinesterase 2-like [Toxorhynchites rutilus septentrionalis]
MLEFIKISVTFLVALVKFIISNQLLKLFPPSLRPIVEVRQGKLRGATSTLPNGSPYHYFKGVPYAKPPVGELRFQAPVAIEKFYKPVVDCLVERSVCIQPIIGKFVVGKENGLFLNIYTPKLPTNDQSDSMLPVMIWIHGGGFISGSADSFIYDPVYLVQEGVIVVTMNYRLGALGFLSMPSVGITGNAGLKDQLLVFKWVNENIVHFGGNPANVTIFGESAGSMSAYLHYLSPNSRKHFHRVICQSGVACSESFFQSDGNDRALRLAKSLGYEGNDLQIALETLRKAPVRLLIKHQNKVLNEREKRLVLRIPFLPVIEKKMTEDSIITELPEQILKNWDTIRMPIINGCTDGEGILGLRMILNRLEQFDQEPERLVPQLMGELSESDRRFIGHEVKQFYFSGRKINENTMNEMCDLLSDNTFITNSVVSAEWIAIHQPNVKQYHYRFVYQGKLGITKKLFNLGHVSGVSHGDDIFYLFRSRMLPHVSDASDECRVRNIFVRLWTNFAKYDDPTPNEDDPLLPCKWAKVMTVNKTNSQFDLDSLEINCKPTMVRNPCGRRLELWRNILQKYRRDFL